MQRNSRSVRRSLSLLLALLFVLGVLPFWHSILLRLGRSVIVSEPAQPADLILVLGGNFFGQRVLQAAELCVKGYAPLVLFSGAPYRGRPEGEWSIGLLESKGYPKEMFAVASRYSTSTREEAVVMRGEFRQRHARRVILVTSSYHSRRAEIVFKLACPDVQFISVPASDPDYQPDRWWADSSSRKLLFLEWSKIIGTIVLAPYHRS
jgi:uncharacterized SAM-binding protein YcdF (DUF218 family)